MVLSDSDDDDQLLNASRQAYKSSVNGSKASSSHEAFTDGTDLVTFDTEIPPATPARKSSRSTKSAGKKKAGDAPEVAASLEAIERSGVTRTKKPSKREIQEYRSKTTGPGWYNMPAFPGAHYTKKDARTEGGKASYTGGDARAATEKEMRRQVTAIRLRNALDPTRFYRGGTGTGADKGMPAYAQLGTIVGGGLEPKSIVPRKQRADSVVGELVNDARSIAYSKKKFNELQAKRMALAKQGRSKPPGRRRRRS
ncbi:fcf2 [Malassezia furfur]|nr:fcf2 [Malassezia furfur]